MDKRLGALLAAVAAFCGVTLIIVSLSWACNRRKRNKSNPVTTARGVHSPPDLTSIAVDESASFDSNLHISMAELVRATEMFSPDLIVGDGGFGLVYKATLSNGTTVAVKKLSPDAFQGFREFRAEMETLGKLQNRNIVKILGYCASYSERILVYEFVERGSLDQWLYECSWESKDGGGASPAQPFGRPPLCWDTRVKIVTGVARGLSYLHGLPKPIIHRDIKASNVLLDANFEAHIADFGLARRIDSSTHVTTQAAGTMGYMPPEYKEGLTLATPRVDIYSFGILMLEIFTGRRPNLPTAITVENSKGVKERKEVGLIDWAKKMVAEGKEMEMVDCNIVDVSGESIDESKVKEYFGIAMVCTSENWKRRPAMAQVLDLLNQASASVEK